MTDRPLRVGVLGAGMIATGERGVLQGMPELAGIATVVAIASRTRRRAEEAAERFGIDRVHDDLDGLVNDDQIDAVVNLTPIADHYATSLRILGAGRHLASEKPFTGNVAEADHLIAVARENDRSIVVSPPRMVEPSRRRARALIENGAIGHVTFARARASHAGPAALNWPVDPAPYYSAENPPLLDLAPYAIHQLTGLLGPARAVIALSGRIAADIVVENGPFEGRSIAVEGDDNTVLMLDFGTARFGLVDAGFSVRATRSPAIEVFGTAGTIALHTDYPPRVGGSLELFTPGEGWTSPGAREDHADEQRQWRLGRAVLVEELARTVRTGCASPLSADRARHCVDVLAAALRSMHSKALEPVHSSFA